MKLSTIHKLLFLALLLPFSVTAQSNIQSAFDKLIEDSQITFSDSHGTEMNSETGIKEGMYDVYDFHLPLSKMYLIKNIEKAFRQDKDKAYSYTTGTLKRGESSPGFAIGKDGSSTVTVAPHSGSKYMQALFLAPKSEDATGNYRYAYGLSYLEGKNEIQGRLCVTYATTLQHRQRLASTFNTNYSGVYTNNSNVSVFTPQEESWFSKFMTYVQSFPASPNLSTYRYLATKIYEISKEAINNPNIDETDKNTAREIIKSLLSDDNWDHEDSVTNQLLTSAMNNLR